MAHPGGRPRKFKTPEEMQAAIDAYFAKCDPHVETFTYLRWKDPSDHGKGQELVEEQRITEQVPYTMSGLALALDFESRSSLVDYQGRDKFSHTIKAARKRVEVYVETLMLKSNGVVAGVIFNAKNNFGWRDRSEQDLTTNGKDIPAPILGGIAKRDVPADDSTPKA